MVRTFFKNGWMTPWIKPAVFGICLFPLVWLAWDGVTGHLGANPIEAVVRRTGVWAINFLLISLAVTPARRLPGGNRLIAFRRMLGLFAFFYAGVHLMTYVGLDQFFAVQDIVKDVIKRPFITIGMASFILLVPLAVTSTNRMIARLGGARWRMLHRLVYVIGIGGVLHYFWLVKADIRSPLIYAGLLAALLGARVWIAYGSRLSASRPAPRDQGGMLGPRSAEVMSR
ncbi:MAG TPA: protein-methionine-sulfoxide reductase heme-binding subunit MsrQ [Nitrospiria bacterium]|nr:protein-methionine-sulfoxide reductase heme-binding subunit MsrQ [Nitrospiria bacterium]